MRSQRGVAIIVVLLVVAIVSMIATYLTGRMQLSFQRTNNMLTLTQGSWFAQGAEDFVSYVLTEDEDSEQDTLQEDWAMPDMSFPIQDGDLTLGQMQGQIFDRQACFNLNSLVQPVTADVATGRAAGYTAGDFNDEPVQKLFARLLSQLELEPDLLPAIIDWLDSDDTARNGGAEDSYYASLKQPYRAANQLMSSVSELRLIKGFEQPEVYQRLKDLVCVLPTTKVKKINVNTIVAPELLMALAKNLSLSDAQRILDERDKTEVNTSSKTSKKAAGGFKDKESLKKEIGEFAPEAEGFYGFNSQYFELRASILVGDGSTDARSQVIDWVVLLLRDQGKVQVLSRRLGEVE